MRITKAMRAATALVVALGLWLAAVMTMDARAVPGYRTLVLLLPVLAVLCFGVYSIASIVYSLIVFRDVPEELQVLQRDIALARKELAKKGFKSS